VAGQLTDCFVNSATFKKIKIYQNQLPPKKNLSTSLQSHPQALGHPANRFPRIPLSVQPGRQGIGQASSAIFQ